MTRTLEPDAAPSKGSAEEDIYRQALSFALTCSEREAFERDGYLVVPDALPADLIEALIPVADRIDREGREAQNAESLARMNHYDIIGRDPRLLTLLDYPTTIARVWGLLGWNISLYHTHLTINPSQPQAQGSEEERLELGWHQDSGQLNADLETSPRPRISLKIGYFLTDTRESGRGNLYVLPGSHHRDDFPGTNRRALPDGAIPIRVPPGTAVFFDRRLWHSGSANYWHTPRRVIFYGYAYRWLRPRDDMEVSQYIPACGPLRRQLLGQSVTGGRGYTSPTDADVPLKGWLEANAPSTRPDSPQ